MVHMVFLWVLCSHSTEKSKIELVIVYNIIIIFISHLISMTESYIILYSIISKAKWWITHPSSTFAVLIFTAFFHVIREIRKYWKYLKIRVLNASILADWYLTSISSTFYMSIFLYKILVPIIPKPKCN